MAARTNEARRKTEKGQRQETKKGAQRRGEALRWLAVGASFSNRVDVKNSVNYLQVAVHGGKKS